MVPSAFLGLEALPLNRNGKVDRRALARLEHLPPAPDHPAPHQPPATATEKALADVWCRLLGRARVGRDDDFFELGGHSLRAVRLMAEIERRFGVELPLATLFRRPRLAQLARRIERPAAGDTTAFQPLVEIASGTGQPPFFCIHPVGGNVLCYRELARNLGNEHPFYGIQASPGNGRPPAYQDVGTMAESYLRLIREARAHGPYLLGGWSMGGLVAFEIARRLRARGEEPAVVALIDVAVPGSPSADGIDETPSLLAFATDLGLPLGERPPWNGRGDAAALSWILQASHRRGLVDGDLDLPALTRLYRLFESNDRAMRHYRPETYDGRLTLLRTPQWAGDPTLGWAAVARRVDVRIVGGDHYTMVREPHVRELAAKLKSALRRAGAVLPAGIMA